MPRAGTQSSLSRYLVKGIPEMERTIRDLTDRDLGEAVLGVLEDIGTPTRRALINYYTGRVGKHDNESLKRAMSHRWWSKKRQQGLPVGFTRVLAARKLFTDGFGFKVAKLKRGAGFFLRIKAWGPGIHLVEKGRYKSRRGNNYTGWRSGLSILKRFENWAVGALNTRIGPAIEKAALNAARRNGVRQ